MSGKNLFQPPILIEIAGVRQAPDKDCIFISHSSNDKSLARQVDKLIRSLEVNTYFDENDGLLQIADGYGDHQEVVRCIEDGIANSRALLGIITENTKGSWWVPYEIGSARGHGISQAHLIAGEVEVLPSFIQASTILEDLESLKEWTLNFIPGTEFQSNFLKALAEAMPVQESYASALDIPVKRSVPIRFEESL